MTTLRHTFRLHRMQRWRWGREASDEKENHHVFPKIQLLRESIVQQLILFCRTMWKDVLRRNETCRTSWRNKFWPQKWHDRGGMISSRSWSVWPKRHSRSGKPLSKSSNGPMHESTSQRRRQRTCAAQTFSSTPHKNFTIVASERLDFLVWSWSTTTSWISGRLHLHLQGMAYTLNSTNMFSRTTIDSGTQRQRVWSWWFGTGLSVRRAINYLWVFRPTAGRSSTRLGKPLATLPSEWTRNTGHECVQAQSPTSSPDGLATEHWYYSN